MKRNFASESQEPNGETPIADSGIWARQARPPTALPGQIPFAGWRAVGLIFFLVGLLAVRGDAQFCRHCCPSFEVAVIGDERGTLAILQDGYHTCRPASPGWNGYIEAVRGERYRIRFTNSSHDWVGVVIAVDGRNIVSGRHSSLSSNEGMYVLEPHSSSTFEGWRSSLRHVNRFYFTDQRESYAGSYGDYSDLGAIRVAVYRSRNASIEERYSNRNDRDLAKAPSGSARAEKSVPSMLRETGPGTGYGESQYSPVERVHFDPEYSPMMTWSITYRWAQPSYPRFPSDPVPPLRERDTRDFAPPPPRR